MKGERTAIGTVRIVDITNLLLRSSYSMAFMSTSVCVMGPALFVHMMHHMLLASSRKI
ncbi:MAG: hypothetical protein ACE14P_01295 [Methanotrichaceae archaeon]